MNKNKDFFDTLAHEARLLGEDGSDLVARQLVASLCQLRVQARLAEDPENTKLRRLSELFGTISATDGLRELSAFREVEDILALNRS